MHVCRAVGLLAALSLLVAGPAAAHTDLSSSSPKDGATLAAAPARIALTFREDLLPAGDRLVARDAQGARVSLGQATVDGPVLSAAWPPDADSGSYRVAYRAVAADGHPLEGTVSFTVQGPRASTPQTAQTAQTPQTPAPDPGPTPEDQSGPNLLLPLGLVVALLVGGLFVWRARA